MATKKAKGLKIINEVLENQIHLSGTKKQIV